MDVVYQRAEVTIIAAGGKDEQYGLPGVGTRARRAQRILRIDNMEFLSGPIFPYHAISSSKWYSRGWTYQEGR